MSTRANRFKKGVDKDDARRRREESSVSIRKNKREEGLAKRRGAQVNNFTAGPLASAEEEVTAAGAAPKKTTFTADDIPSLLAGLTSENPQTQYESVRGYRKVLSIEPSPPVQEVLATNPMPAFIFFLQQTDRPNIQFEAAWALTNIASTDMTKTVCESGAVPVLVQMLLSPNADVREQCAWCLGNIAGDCAELRDATLEAGALNPLLQNIMQPASESMLRNAVWALSNFCRGKPQPKLNLVRESIPVLAQCLQSTDKDVLMDTCWALSYLSDGADDRIEAVCADRAMVQRLVQLLSHESPSVITPALRTIGNIVTGPDAPTQMCVDAGCLVNVAPLLSHPKKGIRKESCWMLSNIAAGSRSQISALMAAPDVVAGVLGHMNGSEWDVRKEAAWVISNIATGGDQEQIFSLLTNHQAVEPICSLLEVSDVRIVTVALDALDAMLKVGERSSDFPVKVSVMVDECDGIEKLEMLQEHENEDVYNKAVGIIEKYFGAEDEVEGENVAPAANGNTFAFGAPAGGAKPFSALTDAAQAIVPAAPQPFAFNANSFNFNAAH